MVLAWSTIAYGAVLSSLLAAVLVSMSVRPRRPVVIGTAALGAAVGPLAWNAILHRLGAAAFFDAPIPVFPIRHFWANDDAVKLAHTLHTPVAAQNVTPAT